jgi:hypothetical protein
MHGVLAALLLAHAAAIRFRSRMKVHKLTDRVDDEKSAVQVAVFEEHDEAIPYWFAAFRDGRLSKAQNNTTLIHLDAHPDMALPYTPIPPMQFPRSFPSKEEQRSLMTGNDIFIIAAMLYGIVDKLVWVYPGAPPPNAAQSHILPLNFFLAVADWDTDGPRHTGSDRFHLSMMHVGWRNNNPCSCEVSETMTVCEAIDNGDEDGDEITIKWEECSFVNSVPIERISRSAAMRDGMTLAPLQGAAARRTTRAASKGPQTASQYMLDIDEDFFGVSTYTKPYNMVSGSKRQRRQLRALLGALNKQLANMVAPLQSRHEQVLDYWFCLVLVLSESH